MSTVPCLDALDGIRGLCSLWVVVGHLIEFWISNDGHGGFPVLALEYMSGVTLFFVISGYTLVVVYDRPGSDTAASPLTTWEQKKDFFYKRIARLAPIYYLGLLVGIAPLVVYESTISIIISVPTAFFWIQSVIPLAFGWNSPLWTVSSFAVCYLVFPRFLRWSCGLTSSQLKWRFGVSCLASLIIVCIFIAAILSGVTTVDIFGFMFMFAFFRIPQFATGIYAGLLAKRCPLSRPTLYAEICSCLLVVNQIICAVLGTGNNGYFNWHKYVISFVLLPVHAVWVSALTHPECRGPTRALLSNRPACFLGQISYALYCLHFPVISWCCWAVAGRGVSSAAVPKFESRYYFFPAWAIIPVVVVCIAVAAIAFYLVEEPARRRMTGRSKGREALGPKVQTVTSDAGDAAGVGDAGAGGDAAKIEAAAEKTVQSESVSVGIAILRE
jgi:peptidoglycan/LPS O-acetylase OafA/YrhL